LQTLKKTLNVPEAAVLAKPAVPEVAQPPPIKNEAE